MITHTGGAGVPRTAGVGHRGRLPTLTVPGVLDPLDFDEPAGSRHGDPLENLDGVSGVG